MNIKTTITIAILAALLTACGKEEQPKASAPAQAPAAAPAATAPAVSQPAQADGKVEDTAANGGPRLKKSDSWSR